MLVLMMFLGMFIGGGWSQENGNADASSSAVYIVTLKQAPTSHSYDLMLKTKGGNHRSKIGHGFDSGSGRKSKLDKPRYYCFLCFCFQFFFFFVFFPLFVGSSKLLLGIFLLKLHFLGINLCWILNYGSPFCFSFYVINYFHYFLVC